jgi:hypothetical protein
MRGHVLTRYIVRNRLNLEAFFEPIIDFIEIGNPKLRGAPPLRELYMRISSRTAQTKKTQYCIGSNGYGIESWKLTNPLIQSSLKIGKGQNPKDPLVVIMPKNQVGLSIFMLIIRSLLNLLFTYFFLCVFSFRFFLLFVYNFHFLYCMNLSFLLFS